MADAAVQGQLGRDLPLVGDIERRIHAVIGRVDVEEGAAEEAAARRLLQGVGRAVADGEVQAPGVRLGRQKLQISEVPGVIGRISGVIEPCRQRMGAQPELDGEVVDERLEVLVHPPGADRDDLLRRRVGDGASTIHERQAFEGPAQRRGEVRRRLGRRAARNQAVCVRGARQQTCAVPQGDGVRQVELQIGAQVDDVGSATVGEVDRGAVVQNRQTGLIAGEGSGPGVEAGVLADVVAVLGHGDGQQPLAAIVEIAAEHH
jgi:hypothetical protein